MNKSSAITLPSNHPRRQQLGRKLEEYHGRLEPLRPPESQMDTICKIAVLEALLSDKGLDTHELSKELFEKHKESFNLEIFAVACSVIIDYCATGGQDALGGTGLE